MVSGSGEAPRYSHDGGRTWAETETRAALGQEDNFSHKMGSRRPLRPGAEARPTATSGSRSAASTSASRGTAAPAASGPASSSTAATPAASASTRPTGRPSPRRSRTAARLYPDRRRLLGERPDRRPRRSVSQPGGQIVAAIDNKQHISGGGTVIHPSGRILTLQGNVSGKRVPCIMQPRATIARRHPGRKGDRSARSPARRSSTPSTPNTAFLGMYRADNLDAATLSGITFTDITYGFLGASGAGGTTAIFGATKDKTDKVIRRSTDRGASWTPWATATAGFRPVDPTRSLPSARIIRRGSTR